MKTQAPHLLRKKNVFGLEKSRNQQRSFKEKKDGTGLVAIVMLFAILALAIYYYYF